METLQQDKAYPKFRAIISSQTVLIILINLKDKHNKNGIISSQTVLIILINLKDKHNKNGYILPLGPKTMIY